MKQEIILKKNIFGGFRRSDVIDCLVKLSNNSDKSCSEDIIKLKQRISELEIRLTEQQKLIDGYNKSITDKSSRRSADEQLTRAKEIVGEINIETEKYIKQNGLRAESILTDFPAIKELIENIGNDLSAVSSQLERFSFESIEMQKDGAEESITTAVEITEETQKSVVEATPDENEIEETVIEDIVVEASTEKIEPEIPTTEPDIPKPDITPEPEEAAFNSIDNFFAEMDKLIALKKNPEPYLAVINENPIEHLE